MQHHQTNDDLAATTLSQLRTLHPGHPFVKSVAQMEASIERVAGN